MHAMSLEVDEVRGLIARSAAGAAGRQDLWANFAEATGARTVAELGVHEGEFAAALLGRCPGIARYYLIDPWRRLDGWDKPLNGAEADWEARLAAALARTAFAAERRVVLRGTTLEVVDEIAPHSLDLAYIDGDHTLRGIATDLIAIQPKVRPGGWIAGDDFQPGIWQHGAGYEPTLVFPMAVHFAEAMRMPVFALPFGQFLILNAPGAGFRFEDPDGRYADTRLRSQLSRHPGRPLRRLIGAVAGRAARLRRRLGR